MAVGLYPKGRTRFAKLGMVINDEMTQTFRDLLQGQVRPNQIFTKAKASKAFFNRLSKDQIVSLHDAQTKGSYEDLDITLMYTLLRNICPNIPPPAKGWGIAEFPDVGEVGISDDIERIRLIRNKVYGHASSASVSQTVFNEYWGMISDICHRFQAHQGGSYVDNLQTLLETTIDEEQEQQYIEKMKADCEKDKSILEKVSSIESTVKTLASRQRHTYNKRSCRSTLKVHVKAISKSKKAKSTVGRSMEMAKRALNQLVEFINEDADEDDMCRLEDSIKEFLESSTGKKHVAFITQLLENIENKIKQNSQHRKIRMAITKRFLSLVLFFRTNYQATFEVDRGSLLFTFYFETRLGYDRFLEDMRKGVIQQELSNVVQYEPFLWIFKLKKDDVMIEVEEYIENGTDDKNIEKESISDDICFQCPGMIETVCDACGRRFCAECWKTHPHHKGESISALPFTHCEIHENVACSKYCKECDTHACDLCVSERHSTHNIIDFSAKYQKLKTDTEELRSELFDIYKNIHSNMLQKQKELPQKYEIIKNKIKDEGQIWHDRVDASVDMYIAALQNMQNEHLSTLELGIEKMEGTLQEISKKISQNTDIADYAFDIERFRIIPEWSDFKFPIFEPSDVKEEDFEIGNLTPAVRLNVQELHLYPETLALPVRNVKQLIENPVASEHLSSGLGCLTSVALDSEERVLVNGYHHDSPSQFHLSTSSEQPWKVDMFPPEMIIFDMCFKAEGELVFSEIRRGSVNTWKDEQVKTLIEFEDWTPLGIGATRKHLLICMINIHSEHKKIVRYPWSGHDIRHVEFDGNGHPLFSNVNDTLYIAENRNLDLCVSDYGAGRVVVLDKTGKIRFFYDSKEFVYSETFGPRGITTDDMSRILVADSNDYCIHVIDRDGTPLSFIRNDDIHVPWTVNVAGDKLIIGNYSGGDILVLKYLE
ncbi:uncharacterized protein LOC130050473 isoform X2 [Ostrea edulis]|uniref:uncharacterized protein LOC130050473 isoform X2 n=1 Tax=Ostrea edulis TaxID=37623 RepID=UPI0024AFDE39|nr:uncharacterized protein LOC130050473 isoform X2 [Ostrea edulis]